MSLDLSNNFVGSPNAITFQKFTGLTQLGLRDTKLTDFDFNLIKNNAKIAHLDISSNNLKHLKIHPF